MATTRRVKAAPQQSLIDLIHKHNEITLRIAFFEAVLDLCRSTFEYQDGVEPESLVMTEDGRAVGADLVTRALAEIETNSLSPLRKELEKLSKVKM